MQIKSYFAATVESAIDLAGRELGPEALLLATRPAGGDVRHLGAYEVIVGLPDSPKTTKPATLPRDLRGFLIGADCSSTVVDQAVASLNGKEATDREAMDALATGVSFEAETDPLETRVIALTGPTGAGKTTTLCKLAIRENLRRPALMVDTDSRKIGAGTLLRRVSEIAGIEYRFASHPEVLGELIQSATGRSIFIDTPGFPPAAEGQAIHWVEALREIPKVVVHLVLSATARTADLTLTLRRYSMFVPQRLIFTRLDECASAGGILSTARESGLPLSWFGTGQDLTGDIERASPDRLFQTLFAAPVPSRQAAAVGGGAR